MSLDEITNPEPKLPRVLEQAIGKFKVWAEQHLLAEQDMNTITVPLYHYTNGQGLRGILESGRVWFTDYQHLNDPSELTHGIEVAHDMIRSFDTGAEIMVGPAASPDAEQIVRTMLASLGLDPNIEVGRSDIPYRAL
jgi:hypothetical protein